MYFNDIHILVYLLVGLIGLGVGFFVDWCNHRLPEYKKILSKEIISEYKTRLKPNYIIIAINGVAYIVLLAVFGIKSTFMQNLDLVKYLFLIPMLLSAFVIDYKIQIIPNRLTLTMFEVGLVITFLSAMANIYVAIDAVIGMIVGAGIFLLISLIGGAIAGKEAMGFGDVKLMGALGLYFGFINILLITILSFLIGAVLSIVLLATKKKKNGDYIPFGPFIVIATIIVIFIPNSFLIPGLLKIFTLGMYHK